MANGRKSPFAGSPIGWPLIALIVALLLAAGGGLWWWNSQKAESSTTPSPKTVAESSVSPKAAVQTSPPQQSATMTLSTVPPASPSHPRSPYKGFWYEKDLTPQRLAKLIEDALARDPSGTRLIDAAKCDQDGSCAAPVNYLESFSKYDPGARLTQVSQLPAYVRKLVMDCTIKGRFEMADIYLPGGSGQGRGRTETHRMSRLIDKTECVFKNPETGRPVIAQKCANPVGKQVAPPPPPPPPPPPCAYYDAQVKEGDMVIVAITSARRLPKDACVPAIRVAGTKEFVSPNTLPTCLRSRGYDCDLSVAARMAGGPILHQVAYVAQGNGTTILRLPAIVAESGSGYAIVTCLVRKGESSCGVITKPKHYRFNSQRKARVATVYDPERLPKSLLESHWDQYWRRASTGCPERPN